MSEGLSAIRDYDSSEKKKIATGIHAILSLCSTDKELHKRQDMLSNLKSRAKQMATSFNMSNFANRSVLVLRYQPGSLIQLFALFSRNKDNWLML